MAALAEPLDIMKLVSLRPQFGTFVPRGEVLYSDGEEADELYVVMSGRVQVERPTTGDEVIVPGGLVGEVDLFADEPRAGSAKTLSDCSLLVFDRDSISKLAELTPTFALLAIRNACQRVVRLEHLLTDGASPAESSAGSPLDVDAGSTGSAPAVVPTTESTAAGTAAAPNQAPCRPLRHSWEPQPRVPRGHQRVRAPRHRSRPAREGAARRIAWPAETRQQTEPSQNTRTNQVQKN